MAEPVGVILAAGVIVTGSTVVRDAHEGKTHAAPIVFGFMMVTALLVISMASPKFARGLAYMSMVGAFVVNGPAVFSIASGISQSHAQTTAVHHGPGPQVGVNAA